MGTVSSTDTRRISFDNTFALKTLAVQNSIEDENINAVLQIENLPSEISNDIPFNEGCKPIDVQEGDSDTDYWSQRLEALKKEHQLINQIVESEYEKTAETAKKNYAIVKNSPEKVLKIKPCFDWRAKILQCYEDNPRQPLVCSNVVKAFSSYVASCRTAKD